MQLVDRIEAIFLDGAPGLVLERRAVARLAKFPIGPETSGAPCNLSALGIGQPAMPAPVKFGAGCKGDTLDIEIKPHADGIRGDQIVDLSRLVERDLRVSGARAKRAHDNRRAAFLALQQLANGVDLLGREGDDSRALGQFGDLGRAGIVQLREALSRIGGDVEIELTKDAPHRLGTEQHGFGSAPCVQDAVGEDVAAIIILGKLDLINGEEVHALVDRHGFDGADPVARLWRLDPFLACDQRDGFFALCLDDPVIDLARKQAKRQADHARAVSHHAFDGVVSLAGIGRPENGLQGAHMTAPARN